MVFRNRLTQDPRKSLGSVAGIGGAAPLEIRPLSRSGSTGAVTGGRGRARKDKLSKTPNVTAGNSPKSPPPGLHPPAAGESAPPEIVAQNRLKNVKIASREAKTGPRAAKRGQEAAKRRPRAPKRRQELVRSALGLILERFSSPRDTEKL